MISNIKNRYSFFYIEFLAFAFFIYIILSIFKYGDTELNVVVFFYNFFILSFLTLALILYTFELIFPEFRIPQKIVNHILYKIWFYSLLPFSIILLLLALNPLISIIVGFFMLIFKF